MKKNVRMLRFVTIKTSQTDEVLLGHQIPVIDVVFDAVDGSFHDSFMRALCSEEDFIVELGSEDRKRVTVFDELALDRTDVVLVEIEDGAALHGFELSEHAGLLVFRVLHIDGPCFVYAYNIGIFMRILNPKIKKISVEFPQRLRQALYSFCYDLASTIMPQLSRSSTASSN